MGLMNRERYDEAAVLAAFAASAVVLWLAGLLVGLASAPRRPPVDTDYREPIASFEPWPQALRPPRLGMTVATAICATFGLAWAMSRVPLAGGSVYSGPGLSLLLVAWFALLGIALVAMSGGRVGARGAAAGLALIGAPSSIVASAFSPDESIIPPYPNGNVPLSSAVILACGLAIAFVAPLILGWTFPYAVPRGRTRVDVALAVAGAVGIASLVWVARIPHSVAENPNSLEDVALALAWFVDFAVVGVVVNVIGWRLGRRTA